MAPERMIDRPLIDGLQQALADAVRPCVAGVPAVALLDFPAHTNVGDSAIWLGADADSMACIFEWITPEVYYGGIPEKFNRKPALIRFQID